MAAQNNQPSPMQIQQQNDMARQIVVANSVKMEQQIFSQNIDPTQQTTINIGANAIRFAGMLIGFIVEVEGTIVNTAAGQIDLGAFGTANLVKQFRFDDLSNYTRIQTSGRHLALLNTVRQGFAYGGAYAPNLPISYGNNFDVFEGASSVAAGVGTSAVRQVYYMPIAYAPNDLRGGIFMQTTAATMNLQIELNDTPCVAAGASPLNAVYVGNAAAGYQGNITVTVYQVYLDQIPRMPDGQPILPALDGDTIYDLKETTFPGVSVGQDFPMAYSNYRAFLSTLLVYDNGGVLNPGSDVNYFSLASANFTNLFKYGPKVAALKARMATMADLPDGTYLFDSRVTPINTINFGNMELNINASVANANARTVVGYEAFARIGQVKIASSLAGG